jgi:poly-gamma-glutamate synthase PgsB/CapB
MRDAKVRELLELGTTPYEQKLNARLTDQLHTEFRAWHRRERLGDQSPLALDLLAFLRTSINRDAERYVWLVQRHADFVRRRATVANKEEEQQLVLDFAGDLGASARQLRGDRRAFARWFGPDAVTDRYVRRRAELERQIAWCLRQLGAIAGQVLASQTSQIPELWQRLELERTVGPLLRHEGDSRVAIAAFRSLTVALRALSPASPEQLVTEDTLAFIYRAALDARLSIWIQCEAIDLLQYLSLSALGKVLDVRLREPQAGDDLFVRRTAVRVLTSNLASDANLARLLPVVSNDPSPFVRQALAAGLAKSPPEYARPWLRHLAREDADPRVRAAVVCEGHSLVGRRELIEDFIDLINEILEHERDSFVLRVAMHIAAEVASSAVSAERMDEIVDQLDHLHHKASSLAVRRWAAQAREKIWCERDDRARALKNALAPKLHALKPGKSRWFSGQLLRRQDEALIGRVLAVLAQDDFGYDLTWSWWGARITRGPVFQFRFWRFLYEMRHPDPAKRQAFAHTIGRASPADLRAPSGILAELAQTKVPGEPLFLSSEAGWRPYLPLVDDVVSCLNRGWFSRPVRFCTSEGITELTPPRSLWSRLRARWKLTWSFADVARLRNWQEGDPISPAAYLRALADLGFNVAFQPYPREPSTQGQVEKDESLSRSADPAVARFFPALVPVGFEPSAQELFQRFATYFTSAFENTIPELAIFTGVAGGLFLGRFWYLNYSLKQTRKRIPLVLGGWGTRGKSGTERLKAALIDALGYSLVSKTTGCEAMFLYAPAYGRTREMFLYRSYDKATIWEQRMIVGLAGQLGAEVFLWECMGLTPAYVEILQQHWMRDDLSTLTNTYPDHEDIQGPAGINIPQVMTCFIPTRSRLLTSEEQMRPILLESAREKRTSFRGVGWLEAGLLPSDVLQRFPYEEHPYNIALALAVADELGIATDFALKEMADRVVPDLGVLKTTPIAKMRNRRLQFSNGMSANERHGCLNNWYRLGFDRQDMDAEPGVWLSTVVNNRADRIPRSRVFASILVNDLSADRHVLIGGNLSGLRTYIQEAWDEYAQQLTLWPQTMPDNPLHVLEEAARRFRRPIRDETIKARLGVMVSEPSALEVWRDPEQVRQRLQTAGVAGDLIDSIVAHLSADLQAQAEYRALADRLAKAKEKDRPQLDTDFRALCWKWFESKLVIISNYHAAGDEIIDRICTETPPGFLNRVMGIQNIKGTGLDFVYRWEAWHACHRFCTQLLDSNQAVAQKGLRDLVEFSDFGLVCEEHIRETLIQARTRPVGQRVDAQASMALVLSHMEKKLDEVRQKIANGTQTGGWLASVISVVEVILDASAALRRRRLANQVYADLSSQRISHERAVIELQAVTKRQKGGWLLEKLQHWRAGRTNEPGTK